MSAILRPSDGLFSADGKIAFRFVPIPAGET